MKTHLVTGTIGSIGVNCIRYLLHKKYVSEDIKAIVLDILTYAGDLGTIKDDTDNERYIFIKGDIRDCELTGELSAGHDIDYLVNFMAESHVDRSIEDSQLFLSVDVLDTQNLMDAACRVWATGKDEQGCPTWKEGKHYHQVSVDEVHGSLGTEGCFTEETPLCPHGPYSASKTSIDYFAVVYHDTYHMPISIIHCSNDCDTYHFPEKLTSSIINNILEEKELPIYGEGLNVCDWLYVEDHCKAIDMVVREGHVGEVYNIGGHNEMKNIDIVKFTIKTIHDMIAEDENLRTILKKQVKDVNGNIDISWINGESITYVPDRFGHDTRYAINPTKIKNKLDWCPETVFTDGTVKIIRWDLEYQDWIQEVTSGDYQKYYDIMYTKKRR